MAGLHRIYWRWHVIVVDISWVVLVEVVVVVVSVGDLCNGIGDVVDGNIDSSGGTLVMVTVC